MPFTICKECYTAHELENCPVCDRTKWKSKCLELARVVNRLRIHRMNEDYLLAFELAKALVSEHREEEILKEAND